MIESYYDDMWNDGAGPLRDDEIKDEVYVDDIDETNTINVGASETSTFRLPAQFSPLLSLDEENFNTQPGIALLDLNTRAAQLSHLTTNLRSQMDISGNITLENIIYFQTRDG